MELNFFMIILVYFLGLNLVEIIYFFTLEMISKIIF